MPYKKSKDSYFDVNTYTIYSPDKKSRAYYHELSHKKDMSKKWYRSLNNFFDVYIQIYCFVFIFLVWFDMLKVVLIFFPYAFFRVQEEIRAEIYAYKRLS